MLDIANLGTPIPKGKTIGSRDKASDARLLQETEEENGKEVSGPTRKPPPGSTGRHRHTGSRSKTYAVVLATVKNLVVAAAEKDPKAR